MALAQKKQAYMSPEEFLELRRNSDTPMEYIDGELISMAGSTKAHGRIVASITTLVTIALARIMH
jgi:Uma2 family endonuclease